MDLQYATPETVAALSAPTPQQDSLHKAAHAGDIALVRDILKKKVDPDARDSFGGTALHAAMFQANTEIVVLLINYGLDVNAKGLSNGYTPLHDAVWANNLDAARVLIAHGARMDIRAKDGLTAYEKAVKEGKTEMVSYLASLAGKTVPAAAQCYFDAVASNDLVALTACFTPDAAVIDVSREIKGIDAIRQWANNEVLGGRYEILESESRPGGVRLIVRFIPKGSSAGFRAAYSITFKEGRIAKMDLQYA